MSDSFKAGQYVIRYAELPNPVDVATAQCMQPDPPVRLEPLSVPQLHFQNWVAKPAADGKWVIELWNEVTAVRQRLSIRDPSRPPEGPVITTSVPIVAESSHKEQHWTVSLAGDDKGNNVYVLRPATTAVGVDYCVGVKEGGLHIVTFDIRDPTPRPHFQFIKIAD